MEWKGKGEGSLFYSLQRSSGLRHCLSLLSLQHRLVSLPMQVSAKLSSRHGKNTQFMHVSTRRTSHKSLCRVSVYFRHLRNFLPTYKRHLLWMLTPNIKTAVTHPTVSPDVDSIFTVDILGPNPWALERRRISCGYFESDSRLCAHNFRTQRISFLKPRELLNDLWVFLYIMHCIKT